MTTLNQLKYALCFQTGETLYYIGHLVPNCKHPWVNQETAELILLEYNNQVI